MTAAPPFVSTLSCGASQVHYFDLKQAERAGIAPVSRLPISLRILLENSLRNDASGAGRDATSIRDWLTQCASDKEISFYPARVLMPDSSGVPLIADLAAMRDAVATAGGNPRCVNPVIPVDIVVDHSAVVDHAGTSGTSGAFDLNLALEYQRNTERYAFLKWTQQVFDNVRVVPPAMGIVHQVNLEFLAAGVQTIKKNGSLFAIPDTLVGMDSHTTMINGIGVLGWGVGGIEAAAAMLGQPISMLLPRVIGCRITGRPRPGVTCTDIVLTLTEALRRQKVVGTFVEFFGSGLDHLSVADRATIANMAPEAGATMCFFPPDATTVAYLRASGRPAEACYLAETVWQAQGIWRQEDDHTMSFSDVMTFDLCSIVPSMSGPKRPQDRVDLTEVPTRFREEFPQILVAAHTPQNPLPGGPGITHGSVVIAAITSCTNTSNARAMIGAGLIARALRLRGVRPPPWVKTSLSPGSRVVTSYLQAAGLQDDLDALGFNLVGYGCMTCAGSSGALDAQVAACVEENNLVVASVLSGNRNFEGRTHPLVRANFLGSPALVVAYACAGSIERDLTTEPLGWRSDQAPVMLADVWPTDADIDKILDRVVTPTLFERSYSTVFEGDVRWQRITAPSHECFEWNAKSSYIRKPPYFDDELTRQAADTHDIVNARALLILGDGITTDHISPVGVIQPHTDAGKYLEEIGVKPGDFNTLLSRRANHNVMMRGTFASVRLRNEMTPDREGPWARMPSGDVLSPFLAAERYRAESVPLIVIAGADYGTGSSRDWAAKGPRLLGVRAVIAESFERIHRSNLVGMGILPLQFPPGVTRKTLLLTGDEHFTIHGFQNMDQPQQLVRCDIQRRNGTIDAVDLICRLDIPQEIAWYRSGGILPYVASRLLQDR